MTTRFSNLSLPVASGARRRTAGVFFVLALITWLASANPARAQLGSLQQVQVKDTSALHPPAGARVAIVEFDDLECPFCAQANPTLMQAAAHYKIPWVRHDFLIPGHIWSPRAAIYARWFDAKSKALGDDYRNQVFANQSSIETLGEMNQFTQKFAAAHGTALPFAIDPQGKLAAQVQADTDLARNMGLVETPTIFIVTANGKGTPYIQILDIDRDLYSDIDKAIAATRH